MSKIINKTVGVVILSDGTQLIPGVATEVSAAAEKDGFVAMMVKAGKFETADAGDDEAEAAIASIKSKKGELPKV